MTTYKYSAVDKNGKSINGSIEAESEQKAAEQLKKRERYLPRSRSRHFLTKILIWGLCLRKKLRSEI